MITGTRILMLVLLVLMFGLSSGAINAQTTREGASASKMLNYKLPVTRNGTTITKVATSFWQGEYPGPIIDVSSKKSGKTTVQAYKSLRKLDAPIACSVINGIYHPWSKTKNSVIKNREIEFTCSALQENPQEFQRLGNADTGSRQEQWLYIKCEEGHEAFIQDSALLKTKGVKKGVIIKYGEVGPHTTKGESGH
ncbi:MAG: hypothetical protein H6Q49_1386 [Deltaproteobacteria bacterium]|nr:hypothetical protein [Deltaproteobacteria bacterium]